MDDEMLHELGKQWARVHRGQAPEGVNGRARLLRHVAIRDRRRPQPKPWLLLAAALGTVAALIVVGTRSWLATAAAERRFLIDDEPGQLHDHIEAQRPTLLAFAEGTSLDLAQGARARVEELDKKGARVVLENGHVSARVRKRPETHWRVDAGPYSVVVTGTQFEVDWDPAREHLGVVVSRGSVRVLGPGLAAGRSLGAGEHLEIAGPGQPREHALPSARGSASVGSMAGAAAFEAAPLAAPSSAPVGLEAFTESFPVPWVPPVQKPRATPPAPSAFADTASGTERGAANAASAERAEVTSSELLDLAQRSRRANDLPSAIQAWRQCRERYPGTDAAAIAAFWLGRSEPAADAVPWFAVYLEERPYGALAVEARGRLLEAYATLGQATKAQHIARQYLELHPQGPHAGLARGVLDDTVERHR